VPLPRGDVTLVQDGAVELAARIVATPSDDAFFFYPYMPMLPFLTARQHVSRYDIFLPGYTLPSQYQEACVSVMRLASWVIIDLAWINPDVLRSIFPAMRDVEAREKKRFEQALEHGFAFVARAGEFEVRRRKKAIDERVCASIAE